jgi:CRISP-associated protein Cas1
MIRRTLYFGNPAYLSLGNAQLVIKLPQVEKNETLSEGFKQQAITTIPIEDIGIVLLDHLQITISHGLLDALMQHNVAVVTCNSTHHPSGLLLTLSGHTLQSERYRHQLDATEPLKKQLWAQTINQKIYNQYLHLKQRGLKADYLVPLYKNVKSGDADNAEGIAAAYYWKTLSPALKHHHAEFRRWREGPAPNNLLNYGYAILRATMARSIVAAGLLPTLGIHHHNRYNAYCLADDLMEPFRPLVDQTVCDLLQELDENMELTKDAKIKLLKIPVMDTLVADEKSPLMVATQRTAVSLVKCYEGTSKKLVYPSFA